MARIEWVDRRLREWAAWLAGTDGAGYASMSPLHPDWTPPAPGQTPTMKVARHSDGRATHAAIRHAVHIGTLSVRQVDTLVVHYCTPGLSVADQAARLGCQPETLDQRVRVIHRRLAGVLHN